MRSLLAPRIGVISVDRSRATCIALLPPAALAAHRAGDRARARRVTRGQVCFAVEAALPLARVWQGVTPRERALEVFALLRVWDTERNDGVLIYLLLADRDVEIVADRGIHAKVGDDGVGGDLPQDGAGVSRRALRGGRGARACARSATSSRSIRRAPAASATSFPTSRSCSEAASSRRSDACRLVAFLGDEAQRIAASTGCTCGARARAASRPT